MSEQARSSGAATRRERTEPPIQEHPEVRPEAAEVSASESGAADTHEPSPDDVVLQGHLEEITVEVPHLAPEDEGDTSAASVARPQLEWAEPEPVRKGLGGSALSFGIAALCGSCFVGWLFPVAVLAIVIGVLAIRRPLESSRLGIWAIGLALLSLVYSAGWIWWTGVQLDWW